MPNETNLKNRPRALNPTRFLNRAAVREFLLETAAQTRAHKWNRVSEATLVDINARVMTKCLEIVRTAPSKGKTL
jgi:hypothetical protein